MARAWRAKRSWASGETPACAHAPSALPTLSAAPPFPQGSALQSQGSVAVDADACADARGCPPSRPLPPWSLPQVSKPVQGLVFSMGQDDPLTSENHQERKNGRLAACKLSLFKLKREPRDMDDLQGCLGEKISTAPARDRSLFHSCDLQPGLYSLVPQFRDAQKLGYYTRIFTPPDADVTVWRFSTPLQKWSTALAKEVAGSVPACAVPHDHEAGHQKEEAQENQSVVTVRGGPKTPELALCTIGCRDQRQYDDILTNAFNQADVYNRGQLSVVHAREALQHVIADSPVVENGFNKKWTALSKGSDTWQMRLGDFKDMMEQVLHEMYEFKVAVQQRAAAGSSFAGLGMGMMKRAPGR